MFFKNVDSLDLDCASDWIILVVLALIEFGIVILLTYLIFLCFDLTWEFRYGLGIYLIMVLLSD